MITNDKQKIESMETIIGLYQLRTQKYQELVEYLQSENEKLKNKIKDLNHDQAEEKLENLMEEVLNKEVSLKKEIINLITEKIGDRTLVTETVVDKLVTETREDKYLTREETMKLYKEIYIENVDNYDDTYILREDVIDCLLEMNGDPDTINELRYS